MRETQVRSLSREDPLEKEMATHSSTLAWKIPWREEPGGLYSPWGRKESDTTEQLHFDKVHQGLPWWLSSKESAKQEMWVQSLGWGRLLEKEMATHSNILAWEIPWTEELHGQVGYSP